MAPEPPPVLLIAKKALVLSKLQSRLESGKKQPTELSAAFVAAIVIELPE
jgi:hypothetical protein